MGFTMARRRCLLVVDMLNDFVEPTGALYVGPQATSIVPRVRKLIDEFHHRGDAVIYICDEHDPDDREFERFPPHCMRGTPGADIVAELVPSEEDRVLKKRRYSGFFETPLDEILRDGRFGEVHVVGVCTSICVMETVAGLANRDIPTVVHADAVADLTEDDQFYALDRMQRLFGVRLENAQVASER